jgi:hypothetical protein
MAHLTADQFVDLADSVLAEIDMPHLASCADCRRQLADLRAMMTEAADVEAPEPSPLYWNQLSRRVSEAVAEDATRRRAWHERLLQPRIWVAALAGAAAIFVVVQLRVAPAPVEPLTIPIPSTPLPVAGERAALPTPGPSLPPLGRANDPQLGLVADYGVAFGWDEMRDEVALGVPGASSDAVLDSLTVDEQRELQRLLADEMTQPAVPENRS